MTGVRTALFSAETTRTAVSSPSRTTAAAGTVSTFLWSSPSISTCTGAPAGSVVGERNARRTGGGGSLGFDRSRLRDDGERQWLVTEASQTGRRATGDVHQFGEGDGCDDLEPRGMDDAQHWIRGRRLDDIPGVVRSLGDDAVEARADLGARGERAGGSLSDCASRTAASASASSRSASSTSLRAATPLSNRSWARVRADSAFFARASARSSSPRRVARSADSDGISKRTSTSPAHPVAVRVGHVDDPRRLGRSDDQVRPRRGLDCPGYANHRPDVAHLRRCGRDRNTAASRLRRVPPGRIRARRWRRRRRASGCQRVLIGWSLP